MLAKFKMSVFEALFQVRDASIAHWIVLNAPSRRREDLCV